MAHLAQSRFVTLVLERFLGQTGLKVLEIGSYDVNGSVRTQFKGSEYVGADLSEGPGVDVIGSGHELTFESDTFDVTVSCECFEHNPYWAETFLNMHRMTKPGGILIMTCASKGRMEHGTTRTSAECSPGTNAVGINYYLNLNAKDFRERFDLNKLFERHFFHYLSVTQDLYFVGWKVGGSNRQLDLADFEKDVKAIPSVLPQSPWYVRALKFGYRAPLWLVAQLCDDRIYQSFQLGYFRALKPLKELLKKSQE